MPVVSMRLFNAYGPKQNLRELKQGMVSIFLAQFLKHEKVIVKGSFDRVRDLVYIDDIVSVLKAVLENPRSGVYNLSTGKLTSVGELTRMIKEISGIDKEVVSEGYTSGDIMGFAGNNRKLKDVFGMEAATGIEDGLRKMISYYTRRNLK
jgi:UDP-glucose 4-epimerase